MSNVEYTKSQVECSERSNALKGRMSFKIEGLEMSNVLKGRVCKKVECPERPNGKNVQWFSNDPKTTNKGQL